MHSAILLSCGLVGLLLAIGRPAKAQVAKLTARPLPEQASFGFSVATRGDYAVIGAPFEDATDQGAAYVFFKDPAVGWMQQARLTQNNPADGDQFGYAVDIDGSFIIVGAPGGGDERGIDAGAAYVFRKTANGWRQQTRLTASDAATEDRFGYDVTISGLTILTGAPMDDDGAVDTGSVYAFTFDGRTWTQQAKVKAPAPQARDEFGYAVALNGETALVGAPGADEPRGADAGLAFLYVRSGTAWPLRAVLTAGDAAPSHRFGHSLALTRDPVRDEERALIGTPHAGSRGVGAAYVFVNQEDRWSQVQRLRPTGADAGDNVGHAVALQGDYALVGVPGTDLGASATETGVQNAGTAALFHHDPPNGWLEHAVLTAPVPVPQGFFGRAVALNAGDLFVYTPVDEPSSNQSAVYLFDRSSLPTTVETPFDHPALLLLSSFPNPFHHHTTIAVDIPVDTVRPRPILLAIYDLLGRQQAVLAEGYLKPGRHTFVWRPEHAPDGVYVCRLHIGERIQSRAMLLLR